MADVTADPATARAVGGNGSRPVASDLATTGAGAVDRSRTVRVRLAATSRLPDDPTLVVVPAASPVKPDGQGVLAQRHGLVEGETDPASILSLDAARHRLLADGRATDVVLEPPRAAGRGVLVREVLVDGFRFEVEVEPERLASLRERATRDRGSAGLAGPLEIHAIIPGRVVQVRVAPGDGVTAGESILAIEAMKMQNELLAPRDGTVARVGIAVGETVEIGDLLVVIE